ncbi:uncharacterized protein LOC116416131 [Nasonia vitripennis]|uniref:Uncharacterized protein n=1 Tax=Nasonia vitripennis TaxID=7425 RepID=A0A7M7PYL0_NASVI|nr:uncharacterized protein LOC116416131 [Nasonia vitripennis]
MSRYAILCLTLLLTFTATNCLLTREKLVATSEHVVEYLERGINSDDGTEELKSAMARPQSVFEADPREISVPHTDSRQIGQNRSTNLDPRKSCISEKSSELIIDGLFELGIPSKY